MEAVTPPAREDWIFIDVPFTLRTRTSHIAVGDVLARAAAQLFSGVSPNNRVMYVRQRAATAVDTSDGGNIVRDYGVFQRQST